MQSPSFLTVLYTHSLGVSHLSRENSDFHYPESWLKLIPGRPDPNLSLTFRGPWCILIMKANEMHYFSDLFDKALYMFRTNPLSIIRSILTLFTRNRYL